MQKDDLVFVGHMSDHVRRALDKVRGNSRDEFDADDNLRLAVSYLVQTVGEAASRVSPEYRSAHPELPWREIIGIRHKIVHDYLEIDFDIVWHVARADFPVLLSTLIALLPASDAGRPSCDAGSH